MKILFLVGDFAEDYEVMVPRQMCELVGITPVLVSPGKEIGSTCKSSIHDFEGDQTYSEKRGHNIPITGDFSTLGDCSDYDALYIPGGRAPEFLSMDESVVKVVNMFLAADKPIATVCHGGLLLAATDALKSKKVCCYPATNPVLKLAGAINVDPDANMSNVVVDGNLITGPAWPAHAAVFRALFGKLKVSVDFSKA